MHTWLYIHLFICHIYISYVWLYIHECFPLKDIQNSSGWLTADNLFARRSISASKSRKTMFEQWDKSARGTPLSTGVRVASAYAALSGLYLESTSFSVALSR